jgi:protein-disulfide isomerase
MALLRQQALRRQGAFMSRQDRASGDSAKSVAARKVAEYRSAQRRRTAAVVTGVVVVVLAIAVAVGISVYRTQSPSPSSSAVVPKGGTATGIVVGRTGAPVTVDVYLDFLCPVCREFETTTGPTLDRYVAAGTVRVVYHPVAYLDRLSGGTRYSTRSSAASACAADAGVFPQYLKSLYANQPPEGSTGLTDEQLAALGRRAGATSRAFADCVTGGRYLAWTAQVTEAASRAGVTGTPTVLVDGRPVQPTPTQVTAAIEAAAKAG